MDRTTAVIDLGTMRDEAATDTGSGPTRPFGPRRIRTAMLALTCALLLGATGDVPPSPRQWEIEAVPLSVGVHFRLTDDRMFVVDPTPGTGRRVTAYDVADGRRLWTSEPRPGQRLLEMTVTAGLVLLVDGDEGPARTSALDAGTGQWRWSVPSGLDLLPGERTALDVEDVFPPGSEVDPGNPPPDVTEFHQGPTGMHSKPRSGVTLRAIDLDSGRMSWSASDRTSALQIPAAGGRPPLVLMGERGGGIEVRDLHTGAVRQRLEGSGDPPREARLAGDSLLIRDQNGISAYSADLGELRWTRALREQFGMNACGPMLCLHGRTDLQLVDLATGTTAWHAPSDSFLIPHGDHLVETDNQGRTNRLLDPRTGRTVADLAGWTEAVGYQEVGYQEVGYEEDAPLLLLRRLGAAPRTWLAVLPPDQSAVRLLDPVPYALSACQVVVGAFACRTHKGDTRIWHYR